MDTAFPKIYISWTINKSETQTRIFKFYWYYNAMQIISLSENEYIKHPSKFVFTHILITPFLCCNCICTYLCIEGRSERQWNMQLIAIVWPLKIDQLIYFCKNDTYIYKTCPIVHILPYIRDNLHRTMFRKCMRPSWLYAVSGRRVVY